MTRNQCIYYCTPCEYIWPTKSVGAVKNAIQCFALTIVQNQHLRLLYHSVIPHYQSQEGIDAPTPHSFPSNNITSDPVSSQDWSRGYTLKGAGLISHSSLDTLYYKARSLLPTLSEIQLVSKAYSPSIICTTESCLNLEITDNELSIPGYHLVRFGR